VQPVEICGARWKEEIGGEGWSYQEEAEKNFYERGEKKRRRAAPVSLRASRQELRKDKSIILKKGVRCQCKRKKVRTASAEDRKTRLLKEVTWEGRWSGQTHNFVKIRENRAVKEPAESQKQTSRAASPTFSRKRGC